MIRSWTLKNFKSARDQPELEIAPLTIFAGPNSSGKSTVIQSILMTAQTLQSQVASRSIVLNGHIVKLGAFDDVLSNNHDTNEVSVGFELTGSDVEQPHFRNPRYFPFYRTRRHGIPTSCTYTFSAKGLSRKTENLQLQPQLETCCVKLLFEDERPFAEDEFTIQRSSETIESRLRILNISQENLSLEEIQSLEYEVIAPSTVRFDPRYSRTPSSGIRTAGASFNHFLPSAFSLVYDEIDERVKALLAQLAEDSTYRHRYRYGIEPTDDVQIGTSDKFKQIVLSEFKKIITNADNSKRRTPLAQEAYSKLQKEFSLQNIRNFTKNLYEPQRRELDASFRKKSPEIIRAARGDVPVKYTLRLNNLPPNVEAAVTSIQGFFSRHVKYLGPLRDDPKPIYPISGATDSRDVGIRGEHTAAVLDIHSATEISYIPSESFTDGGGKANKRTAALSDAVLDWLEYMGMASDIKTFDKGKIGRELKVVTPEGTVLHDLIHVGVGISQVLPIVVLALMADTEATLIFEQPEFHLHPKVQTRLADFLLSLSMLNKQCIVETHSEHLINRLCYWAARTEGEDVSQKVVIYFAEYINGQSHYQTVRINKYGVIENWPTGFFDESERNAAEILRAGMEKKKRER